MKIQIRDKDCTAKTPLFLGYHHESIYGKEVRIRPRYPGKQETKTDVKKYLPELLPLEEYDKIIVLFSGGKDSMAAFWYLVELGVPLDKIELWHHDIDGGHPTRRMDWPVTQAYVESFAEVVGVYLRKSQRVNGFFGEVYRIGASYPIEYEDGGVIKTCPLSPKQVRSEELREMILQGIDVKDELKQYGYRMKFPAKSGDLARRWCSAVTKIDVASSVIRHLDEMQELHNLGHVGYFPLKGSIGHGRYCSAEFKRIVGDTVLRQNLVALAELGPERDKWPAKSKPQAGRYCSGSIEASVESGVLTDQRYYKENIKILVVSGERRGESAGRSNYNEMEIHNCNATIRGHRLVHHWRAVIDFTLTDVWEICRRHNTVCHPCYAIGWGRCSCMMCIFGLPKHWAGIRELFPEDYAAIRNDEIKLGFTIDNKKNLDEYIGNARSCVVRDDQKALRQTLEGVFSPDDIIAPIGWQLPVGAFGGSEGGPC